MWAVTFKLNITIWRCLDPLKFKQTHLITWRSSKYRKCKSNRSSNGKTLTCIYSWEFSQSHFHFGAAICKALGSSACLGLKCQSSKQLREFDLSTWVHSPIFQCLRRLYLEKMESHLKKLYVWALIVVPIHLRIRLHFFFFSACLFGMTFAAKEGKSNPQSVDESPMTKPNMGLLNFLWFLLSFFLHCQTRKFRVSKGLGGLRKAA